MYFTIRIMSLLIVTETALALNNYAPYVTTLPVIDGTISAGEWLDAKSVYISYPGITIDPNEGGLNGAVPSASDLSGTWYTKWDNDNLYFAFVVQDDSVELAGVWPGPYYSGDCVQLSFNLVNDLYAQYACAAAVYDFTPNAGGGYGAALYKHGGVFRSLPNAVVAGSIAAGGYVIETALPWSDFDYVPQCGDVHGMGVTLVDKDSGVALQSQLTDKGKKGSYVNPANWNTLTLVCANGCGGSENQLKLGDIDHDCAVNFKDFVKMAESWTKCTQPDAPECMDVRM